MSTPRDSSQASPASAGPRSEPSSGPGRVWHALGGAPAAPRPPADGTGRSARNDPKEQRQGRRPPFWLVFLLLLVVNYAVSAYLVPSGPTRIEVPYTLFRQQVTAGNVDEIVSRGDVIQGTF